MFVSAKRILNFRNFSQGEVRFTIREYELTFWRGNPPTSMYKSPKSGRNDYILVWFCEFLCCYLIAKLSTKLFRKIGENLNHNHFLGNLHPPPRKMYIVIVAVAVFEPASKRICINVHIPLNQPTKKFVVGLG